MPCVGATTRICGGLATGEICTIPKAITNNLPPLEGILISGTDTTINISWETPVDYPDQNVRGHIRAAGSVGYSPDQIQVVPRSNGIMQWTGLVIGQMYNLWLRVEDADEANRWNYGIGVAGSIEGGYFDAVTHKGILVEFQGKDVTFGG